ncbi:MAG TPA: hypothetical protein VIL34_10230 [Actinopolymorphaceae bacterium]
MGDVLAWRHRRQSRAQRALARECYDEALRLAEVDGDDLLLSYALRHLGDHVLEDDSDIALAGTYWERSTTLRQRLGFVPGALAQQLLLATHAQRAGDPTKARVIAEAVGRWAAALGVEWLAAQARGVLGERA